VIGQLLASPQLAFYVACAVLLLAVSVVAVVLRPALALWALAIVYLTEFAAPVPLVTSLVKAGTTHIYPPDALAVVMLIATVIYLIRQPPPARIMLPLSVAGVMFAANLSLGIARFGLHHAVNESRQWLYLLVTTAFVVAAGPWTSRFWRPWFALALCLAGLAWLGVARHGLHPVSEQIIVNGHPVDPRPLSGDGAVGLAFALIALLGSQTISSRRKIIFGVGGICTLIVVQQRTVWALLAVVFLVWAAASLHRHGTVSHRRLAVAGVAVLVTAAVALTTGVATGNVFDRSLAETTAKNSTLQWRLIGWADLLHSDHSVTGLGLGFPFGTGYRRIVQGVVVTASPHSFYVDTLLRLGVIGLVALGLVYWNVWKYRHQAAATLGISALTVALLLVGLLVFSLTYQPGFLSGSIVAGLLVWEREREPQHHPQLAASTAVGAAASCAPEGP
jgi:hypothetical protein